mgnify:CR=1 FL=1
MDHGSVGSESQAGVQEAEETTGVRAGRASVDEKRPMDQGKKVELIT